MTGTESRPKLKRELGVMGTVMMGFGSMVDAFIDEVYNTRRLHSAC